ncbi:nitrogen fixation protein NifQ [Bradyrhizobium sp. cf659]|uniref:nitrogen fixation protein NifQ n=1 Tax=Bradyrhizobium sp. cf659 TaxID=1761771 RepID=UPI0008EC5E45|nr:nitrogen fixation protein NifQ [Bradyrhizobium sp. cf659]SFI18267.1 nitrogen fixation protein NifQ [Bradyrhizobium sp. cf659]
MIVAQLSTIESASSPPAGCSTGEAHTGIEFYRLLTGHDPAGADISDDEDFDRHVLASILAAAVMDGGAIAERAGLSEQQLNDVLARYFPSAMVRAFAWMPKSASEIDDETIMVRDLLLAQRSTEGETGRWLAAMVARRAMEPNHLWEDLGLRERPELSRLLTRHFAPLAARNTGNMRWKRFFYRMLCEDDGFVMCTSPVCTQCNDFDLCFGEESGESRMAERRREFLRGGGDQSVSGGGGWT